MDRVMNLQICKAKCRLSRINKIDPFLYTTYESRDKKILKEVREREDR